MIQIQIFIVVHYLKIEHQQYLQKLHDIQKEKRDKTIHSNSFLCYIFIVR